MGLAVEIQSADERAALRHDFLIRKGADTDLSGKMGNDASFRTYYRLKKPPHSLLMDSPAKHEPVAPFVKIARHLKNLGLSAPDIFAEDLKNNFLLIEDFGDDTFSRLMDKGESAEPLYEMAVDVLAHLHTHTQAGWIDIPRYTIPTLIEETGRTLNWYYPVIHGKQPTDAMRREWVAVWKALFAKLPSIPETLVLRDYHCDNLMVVPHKKGIEACGLLDFQDGLLGPTPYDLVSLLENDRRAVPADMQERLLNRYLKATKPKDEDAFLIWYRVLSAQRQSKILGLFYRLYVRDNKPVYLKYIPQICHLLEQSFKDPILADVAALYDRFFGPLLAVQDIDVHALRALNLDDVLPLD